MLDMQIISANKRIMLFNKKTFQTRLAGDEKLIGAAGLVLGLYIAAAVGCAYMAIAFRWPKTAFGFENYIALPMFLSSLASLSQGLVIFYIVYIVFRLRFLRKNTTAASGQMVMVDVKRRKFHFKKYASPLVCVIALYFLAKIVWFVSSKDFTINREGRFIVDKFSPILLIVLGLSAGYEKKKIANSFAVFAAVFVVSISILVIDFTREAALPFGAMAVYCLTQKKRVKTILFSLMALMFLVLSVVGRGNVPVHSLASAINSLTAWSSTPLEIFETVVGYMFGFSIIQFTYVQNSLLGVFELSDFFYAISPLPRDFYANPPDYLRWNLGEYIPMGGLAEAYRASVFAYYFVWVFLGITFSYSDSVSENWRRALSVALCVLICVLIFQYNLRTTFRVIYIIYGLLVFSVLKRIRVRIVE